jgi:hypothetical protein
MEAEKNRLAKHFAWPHSETASEADGNALPSKSTLEEVRTLFEKYAAEVSRSDLSPSSKAMYVDFANCFVRWMYGGFKPGSAGPRPRRSVRRS